jgi:hypothetical protein
MRVMDRLARITASLVGVSALAFAAGFFLTRVNAASGWYYSTGLCLVGLGVLRMFALSGGVSPLNDVLVKRQPHKDASHAPSPLA